MVKSVVRHKISVFYCDVRIIYGAQQMANERRLSHMVRGGPPLGRWNLFNYTVTPVTAAVS